MTSVASPSGSPATGVKLLPASAERNTPPGRPPTRGCTVATRTTWVVTSTTPSSGLASVAVGGRVELGLGDGPGPLLDPEGDRRGQADVHQRPVFQHLQPRHGAGAGVPAPFPPPGAVAEERRQAEREDVAEAGQGAPDGQH